MNMQEMKDFAKTCEKLDKTTIGGYLALGLVALQEKVANGTNQPIDVQIVEVQPRMSVGELAKLYRVSTRTINRYINENDVPAIQLQGCKRYRLEDFEDGKFVQVE